MRYKGFFKKAFKTMAVAVAVIFILGIIVFLYTMTPQFGQNPKGERLTRIIQSPNYRNGKFQNKHHTPQLTEGYGYTKVLYEYLFNNSTTIKPTESIPSIKTDIKAIPLTENVLIWFGHSSYYIQVDGIRILVDPVFSGNASPLPGGTKAFKGTDIYTASDFPEIDYLLISHDHYDHFDYKTLVALKPKIKSLVCGLGVGAHLERWGYSPKVIIEKDWDETVEPENAILIHVLPARHFSGRALSANNTLWASYLLQTKSRRIYIGGDSGYDDHFARIGKSFGPIDIAILENGQYDTAWKYIHMQPEEVLKAFKELGAKKLFPVHSSKFALGNHAWNEPLERISLLAQSENVPLMTPVIGEVVELDNPRQIFKKWWKEVK